MPVPLFFPGGRMERNQRRNWALTANWSNPSLISMPQRTWRNLSSMGYRFLTATKMPSRIFFIWPPSCLPSKMGSSQKKTSRFPGMGLLCLSMRIPLAGNQSIRKIRRNPSAACAITLIRMRSGDGTAMRKNWYYGRTLHMLCCRNSDLKTALPILMNFTNAKRHDLNLALSHINSAPVQSQHGRSPIEYIGF